MEKNLETTRRQFLKSSAWTAATAMIAPTIIPAEVLGKNGAIAASDRITLGFIGMGGMGMGDMQGIISKDGTRVVAVCDVDNNHLSRGRDYVNQYYNNSDCATYKDFRELLARSDIDAVGIAVPDHWHALIAIEAARRGKDIYAEKPLAYTIAEGRAMVDAVTKAGIVWQTGSQQRSGVQFRRACELVRNGYIGEVKMVKVGLPHGNNIRPGNTAPAPVPKGFDYDMWLGPAPRDYFTPARCHWNFRWISDYSGGQLTDWAGHHIDIAQWGMNTELSAPVEIEGQAEFPSPPEQNLFDTPGSYHFICIYKEGFTMSVADNHQHKQGVLFEGSDGWIHVNRRGMTSSNPALLTQPIGANEIHLYKSTDHRQNFIDCIRTRKKCVAPIDIAHHSIMVAHLGNIAMKLRRKVYWNLEKEQFINDTEADRLLMRPYRSPWHL